VVLWLRGRKEKGDSTNRKGAGTNIQRYALSRGPKKKNKKYQGETQGATKETWGGGLEAHSLTQKKGSNVKEKTWESNKSSSHSSWSEGGGRSPSQIIQGSFLSQRGTDLTFGEKRENAQKEPKNGGGLVGGGTGASFLPQAD